MWNFEFKMKFPHWQNLANPSGGESSVSSEMGQSDTLLEPSCVSQKASQALLHEAAELLWNLSERWNLKDDESTAGSTQRAKPLLECCISYGTTEGWGGGGGVNEHKCGQRSQSTLTGVFIYQDD